MTHATFERPANLDVAFVERVRHTLETSFGVCFEIWYHDDQWIRIPTETMTAGLPSNAQVEADFARFLADARNQSSPRCEVIDARESLLAIPLSGSRRKDLVATAVFRDMPSGFLIRSAQMFSRGYNDQRQVVSLRQENDAFLRQVTNDFEELTFLRGMAELLEVSDLTFDFVAMAEQVLPTLQPLLDSECLLLAMAKRSDGNDEYTPGQVEAIRIWEGERNIEESVCTALIERYADDCSRQPVVKNRFQETPEGAAFPGVENFVQVPVAHPTATIAWIVALNRNLERNLNCGDVPWEISYLEYGTHEATLMSSSAAILATHSRNIELFREREQLLVSMVRALVSAIEAKDEYTRGHSERVALFGKRLGEAVGLPEEQCEMIHLAGLLHDVGKIGVRDAVLSKPDKLDDAEYEEIKKHPELGWGILGDLESLSEVLPGVLFHHEMYNGRGYPDKLAGEKIPLDGRILAIADAYDAMTSDRPYRAGMPQEKAEAILRSGAGDQWDPQLVETFLEIMPDIIEIRQSYETRSQAKRRVGTVKREER